jgi:hypothetical protein
LDQHISATAFATRLAAARPRSAATNRVWFIAYRFIGEETSPKVTSFEPAGRACRMKLRPGG